MKSKSPRYLHQQYDTIQRRPSTLQLYQQLHLRKKSSEVNKCSKILKSSSNSKLHQSRSNSKQSLSQAPLQFSKEKYLRSGLSSRDYNRLRTITSNSNIKHPKSKSKIKTNNKLQKQTGPYILNKQNIRLKKALCQSQQQKQVLSQKLQFFKSNMKSPVKSQYLPKLTELTDLVKSLKKTYQQMEISKLPIQSNFKTSLKPEIQSSKIQKEKSTHNIQSIIKNIEQQLKQIQGYKQIFQNFNSSK